MDESSGVADPKNVVCVRGKRFMSRKSPHPTIISLMPVSSAMRKCKSYSPWSSLCIFIADLPTILMPWPVTVVTWKSSGLTVSMGSPHSRMLKMSVMEQVAPLSGIKLTVCCTPPLKRVTCSLGVLPWRVFLESVITLMVAVKGD